MLGRLLRLTCRPSSRLALARRKSQRLARRYSGLPKNCSFIFSEIMYISPVLLPPEGRVATVTRRGRWDAMGAGNRSVAYGRADERFVAHGEIVRS